MNFGFSPFHPPFQPPPMFGPGRNSFTGLANGFPPNPMFPQNMGPPMFYPNLRGSFGSNVRNSYNGGLRNSFHNQAENQENGCIPYQQIPTYYGAPVNLPFNGPPVNARGSFGSNNPPYYPINSVPQQFQYPPGPMPQMAQNNMFPNNVAKTEYNTNGYEDNNLDRLIGYQEELKSVKQKIDSMYEKAIQRSQASIEMQQKNLENIKGTQSLMFKEYQSSPINHLEEYKTVESEMKNLKNERDQEEDGEAEDNEDYEGDKIGNIKHGSGRMNYANGLMYTGAWENNKKHGFGILTNIDGEQIYAGDWKFDAFDGQGLLHNIDPQPTEAPRITFEDLNNAWNYWKCYEGEFKDGRMHGMGVLTLWNGEKFSGKFQEGMIHGEGSYYMIGGETILGEWAENVIIKKL